MRYLFVHQNFPGQYLHLVRHLAAQGRHEVVFLSEANENAIAGVRKMVYPAPLESPPGIQGAAREFDQAMCRAGLVARAGRSLRDLGFVPDIIIGHHGWGELLDLGDVWPGVPMLGYCEFYYRVQGSDVDFDPQFPASAAMLPLIRAKNAVGLLALNGPGHGQTPTRFQLGTYPAWARKRITVLPEGVDLRRCRPDPAARARPFVLGGLRIAPGEKLVTYVARDLEPYRGFHSLMRALPRILGERTDAHAVLVGGDGVSYGARLAEGTWREWLLREVGDQLPPGRVHFPGRLGYEDYLRLAAVGRARLSDLPVRRFLVAAGGPGLRLRGGGQRHGAGARVHPRRRERAAGALPRPGSTRRARAGGARERGARGPAARGGTAPCRGEAAARGPHRRLRCTDRAPHAAVRKRGCLDCTDGV